MNTSSHKIAMNEGSISLIGNLILFAVKFWAGIVSSSAALIADAWHTLSDSLSSIIIMIAAKVSDKKPDHEHPFGHGRAELIASMIVGVLLSLIAVNFFFEGVHRLLDKTEAHYGLIAIIITAFSVLSKELMAQYAFYAYKRSNRLSVKADGWHHRSDAISSLIILVGIFFGQYIWWIDGVLTIIVALLIAWTAFQIIREGIMPLLGESPDPQLLDLLRNICDDVLGYKSNVHHVHIHRYGDHQEITFHLTLPADMNLKEAHDLVTKIEIKLREEKKIEATIHPEPVQLTIDN